jgi:hypothetical protein
MGIFSRLRSEAYPCCAQEPAFIMHSFTRHAWRLQSPCQLLMLSWQHGQVLWYDRAVTGSCVCQLMERARILQVHKFWP